tara:strand:+ start:304 stop:507 length:204 start_codon:yes stop_codon:yes gene_type:complete
MKMDLSYRDLFHLHLCVKHRIDKQIRDKDLHEKIMSDDTLKTIKEWHLEQVDLADRLKKKLKSYYDQ